MADQTLTPQQIEARLGSLLTTATASRSNLLQSFASDAQQEAAALRKVSDAVAQTAGPADPAVQALARRAAGTDQVTAFTRHTLEKIGTPGTPPSAGDWVVSGRVLDAKGKPIVGAKITLTGDPELRRRFAEAETDGDGRFEVRFLGAEMADIFARAPQVKLAIRSKDGKLRTTTHTIVPARDGFAVLDVQLGKAAGEASGPQPRPNPTSVNSQPPERQAATAVGPASESKAAPGSQVLQKITTHKKAKPQSGSRKKPKQ